MSDQSTALQAAVREAVATGQSLYLRGGDSKRHLLGRHCTAPALDVSSHRGIIDYEPTELVLVARAGTPIVELESTLSEQGQMLAFEPPRLNGKATLGGTLACNTAGPARAFAGSVRDAVLGVKLINGQGELLNFGGQVMKNVAGYDVSRLQAGALGTLGLLTEVSLKVLPRPEQVVTLAFELSAADATQRMNELARHATPLSGMCWWQGRLFLRLAGTEPAVTSCTSGWGGERIASQQEPWRALREYSEPLFPATGPWWRASVASDTGLSSTPDLIDWGGALRWYFDAGGVDRIATVQQHTTTAGGYMSCWQQGASNCDTGPQLSPALQSVHRSLKQALDPAGVFNPGRLYSWL